MGPLESKVEKWLDEYEKIWDEMLIRYTKLPGYYDAFEAGEINTDIEDFTEPPYNYDFETAEAEIEKLKSIARDLDNGSALDKIVG